MQTLLWEGSILFLTFRSMILALCVLCWTLFCYFLHSPWWLVAGIGGVLFSKGVLILFQNTMMLDNALCDGWIYSLKSIMASLCLLSVG